jgi:arsenate reductase (thioredoxin)
MAEGLLRHVGGDKYLAYSAGTDQTFVRPQAIQAMAEVGIDISQQKSKALDQYLQDDFDEVITVCDDANEACPMFPNAKHRRHWSFPDPSKATGSQAEQSEVYRAVREALQKRIEEELLT